MSKPLGPGICTSSSTRSGGAAAIISSAAWPSAAVSACMPCCTSSRARNPAMSGSSSTTRTRNAACATRPEARSLIDDLHPREVVGVFGDARLEPGAVAGLRAVLDLLAERRHQLETVGLAHTLHAVAELAQLLHVARGKRRAQRFDFLGAVFHERRDQVLEVLGNGDGNRLGGHETIIRC